MVMTMIVGVLKDKMPLCLSHTVVLASEKYIAMSGKEMGMALEKTYK